MKKTSVILAVLLALFMVNQPAGAQNAVGVLGGLNLANVATPDPDEELSNRTGFGFGGILDIGIGQNIALRLEPMYLQKGSKVELLGEEANFEFDYFELPVMVKFAFGTSDSKPYVMAGPNIGFLLSAKITNGEELDIKEFLKNLDFGLGFGAGVSFAIGSNSFFVEGRYALGLTNITDDPGDEDAELKTKGIQIFAGFTFLLGSE